MHWLTQLEDPFSAFAQPRAPSAIPRAEAPPGTMYDPNSKKYVKTQLDESRGPQPLGTMWDPYTKQYVKTTGGPATGKN